MLPGIVDIHINRRCDTITHRIVIRTLSYFDIFQYPLTREELGRFAPIIMDEPAIDQAIKELVQQERIFVHQQFYSLQNNPLLAHRRNTGNTRAEEMLQRAVRIGRFLYQFPFVKAIGISGSLSKNFADAQADIDFFIITSANRLWICRTIMHLYKKWTFLFSRQHEHCMNYYIDEDALLLQDQNIFTAMEIKTLLPVSGEHAIQQFFNSNQWSDGFLPACAYREQQRPDPTPSFFKQWIERLGNGKNGERIDNWLYRHTVKRWNKKIAKGKCNVKGSLMDMQTNKHYAKSNPGNFQEKILEQYHHRVITYGGQE